MRLMWTFRRRPSLWARIARTAAIVGSAVGAAVGVEFLRRKLGIPGPRIAMVRQSGETRVSVRSRGGGRRRRRITVTGSRS